ncbi:MAG: TolC family outer membrane protein [Alphaproteobacteria bacterium]
MRLKNILSTIILSQMITHVASAVTMDEAMLNAWNHNPSLQAARASLDAAKQNIRIARADFLPQINGAAGADALYRNGQALGGLNTGDRYSSDVGVSLSQNIVNIANNYNLSATKLGVEVTRANLEAQEQGLLLQAITYYVSVARDTAVYALQTRYENLLSQQYSAVRAQVEVGELTPTDQYLSEASWRGATATKIAALANLNTSKAYFLQIIGLEAKDMRRPYGPKTLPNNLEQAIAEAQSRNPSVIAAEQQLLQSEELLKQARAQRLPTLTADASTGYTDYFSEDGIYQGATEDGWSSSVGINLNVPIFQGGRIDAGIDAARANLMAAEQTLYDTKNVVRQQVTAAWESYRAAQQQVEAYQSQIRASESSANGVRREFEVGTRSLIDLINEDANLVTARVNYENARATEIVAGWSLLQSMGRLTPDVLGLAR